MLGFILAPIGPNLDTICIGVPVFGTFEGWGVNVNHSTNCSHILQQFYSSLPTLFLLGVLFRTLTFFG